VNDGFIMVLARANTWSGVWNIKFRLEDDDAAAYAFKGLKGLLYKIDLGSILLLNCDPSA